jgi:hydrogenase maturation protein HypF
VADRFLAHDRPILHRIDDSVVKTMTGAGPVVLRRARGYAPAPIPLGNPHGRVLLAAGAELANTCAVVRGNFAFLGPHLGDLKNLETEDAFRAGIDHLLRLLGVEPQVVVCDLHPRYVSSRYAAEWRARGVPVEPVQHHEAHASACMAEHNFTADGVVLALDGLGYGPDGALWGGEVLAGRCGRFRRLGHLAPVPQPGGDRAAQEPWRMAASHLRRVRGPTWQELPLPCFRHQGPAELRGLEAMMERTVNSPLTSSCGRLFDAAAAILGFAGPMLYSAQAPMELETRAARWNGPLEAYRCLPPVQREGGFLLDPAPLVDALLSDALADRSPAKAARAFHRGLARLFALGAAEASRATGWRDVFLTGGCLQNAVFAHDLRDELLAAGLRPHFHGQVPPNDGGIAFGQAAHFLGALQNSSGHS